MFDAFKHLVDWLWLYPILIILVGGGITMSITLRFFQITKLPFILKETFGKIFKKGEGDGTITPFQAATSALASTIGAANIVGVPLAIATGGPGAIFWMWIIAIFGCALKYSEIILGIKYRVKNENGEYVGGPMYYLKNGAKMPILGSLFAFFLMVEIAPSIATQSASIVQTAETINIPPVISGIAVVFIVGLVVYGGIKRISKVTEKLVPFMAIAYFLIALIVVLFSFENIPATFSLIFKGAFNPTAAAGGFAGSVVSATIRTGAARGAYSNEAGMGTSTIAHSAAVTDYPARQALWGVFEVIVDTLCICTITALLVLTTGTWSGVGADKAAAMPSMAIQSVLGTKFGGGFLTICMLMFVLSTLIVIIFYGEKQAEYLFGLKTSKIVRVIYLCFIMIGALCKLDNIVVLLDSALACVIATNMIGVIKLRKEVKEESDKFFESQNLK
ncbi:MULTISPECIES: alanine/glycine:cation symporter family protein [Paraclostridium]|uniref:Sodium:alanine symporter family protein n=1 Tax=Paraclostridium bifermentans TaxID=1490 RepID=A0AA44IG68_PARBF|nr:MULTISPECIES: sodium:alanine symporter family protein [Paraclostridium]EQK44000.1 amino acid carrier family protein [[Clostridium] bifermentans ATCC 19299] [Paraclostridium bifermentans ATCC 19299]MBN8047726.1 sodium:alanine symporter family protein [Paraclostridium bifermentans]MBS6508849.1 sodium:alanine symporter family protein [Paraclostridium bifermentans]MBZ6006722.1 sodium:alanine symporter family protein [Paraclostridium bifermentans]MCE9676661.1 sodium:alanine symporter family prot